MQIVLFVGGSMDGKRMILSDVSSTFICYHREQFESLKPTDTSEITAVTEKEVYRRYAFLDVNGEKLIVLAHENIWESGKVLAHIFAHYTAPGGSR